MALLDHKEVDVEEFLGEVGITIELSPHSYLARIPGQGRHDPLLVKLELAASNASQNAKADPGLLAELATLDALRFSDAGAATTKLPELVSACTKSRSPEVLHRALSSYAEDRRLHMHFGLAARALTCALEIPFSLSREVPVTLQRTSYLLANHNWLRAALRCATDACDLCVQLDDREGIGKMLYTRAVMVDRQNDVADAIRLYESSLRYLADSNWMYRFGAHWSLAWCHSQSGHYDVAMERLIQAKTTHRTRTGINWLRVSWLHGLVALHQGHLQEAEPHLREAYEGFRQGPDSITTALVALDLCKALLGTNHVADISEIAHEMISLLTPLRKNPIASAAILRFYDMAKKGNVTLDGIATTIEEIKRSERPKEAPAP